MQESTLSKLEKLFLALADQTRLKLVGLMADREVSVGFLVEQLGESQPKVSRHLAYLRSMGIVATRRDGKWIYYRIAFHADVAFMNILTATLEALDTRAFQIPERKAVKLEPPPTERPFEYSETRRPAATENEMDVFLL